MKAHLFAQGKSPVWFFVDEWGNFASVVGLLVSLVGLAITIFGFLMTWRRQRRFQEETKQAVRNAAEKIALQVLATGAEDLHRLLTAAVDAVLSQQWPRLLDKCRDARVYALRLIGNPHLTDDEQISLQEGADDLTLVVKYIETKKLTPNPPAGFHAPKREAIDKLMAAVATMQARLANLQWED